MSVSVLRLNCKSQYPHTTTPSSGTENHTFGWSSDSPVQNTLSESTSIIVVSGLNLSTKVLVFSTYFGFLVDVCIRR